MFTSFDNKDRQFQLFLISKYRKKYFATINYSFSRYPTTKQIVSYSILIAFGLLLLTACNTQKASIKGPEGNIAYKITLPKGFDTATDRCPMVIPRERS